MAFYTTYFDSMDVDKPNTVPVLHLFVDNDEENGSYSELVRKYENKVAEHNMMIEQNKYPDSGFDLFVPPESSGVVPAHGRKKVDYKVIAMMREHDKTLPFYVYARSSISKTPLQMCNNVGIIDCGYRGHLMSYFANHCTQLDGQAEEFSPYNIEPFTRLTQVCHPCLKPFFVVLHKTRDYFDETQRSAGGFGSTGV